MTIALRSGLASFALGDDQGDIVVLLMGAPPANLVDNRRDHGLWGQGSMPLQGFDEALFSPLLVRVVEGFGDPIGVEHQRVSGEEAALRNRTIPVFEEPHYSAGGFEPLYSSTIAD